MSSSGVPSLSQEQRAGTATAVTVATKIKEHMASSVSGTNTANSTGSMDYNNTNTNNGVAADLKALSPPPSCTRSLEAHVVSGRVAERAAQRNGWKEFHYPPNTSFMKHGYDEFTTLNNFVGSDKCPSEEVLDQELPVLMPIDYDAIRNFGTTIAKSTALPLSLPSTQVTWIGHATLLAQLSTGDGDAGVDADDSQKEAHSSTKRHSHSHPSTCCWNILTDPVFSPHCSPFPNYMGPKRYRPPAVASPSELKNNAQVAIDVVMISHNHYDHLDYPSVVAMAQTYPRCIFVVPLGLKEWFDSYVPGARGRVVELDWHESVTLQKQTTLERIVSTESTSTDASHPDSTDNNNNLFVHTTTNNSSSHSPSSPLTITAVPMCHWSSRRGYDRDKTLWCGFIASTNHRHQASTSTSTIATSSNTGTTSPDNNINESQQQTPTSTSHNFLFGGDTGYFDASRSEIGDRYGPIDVAALPIGAYYPRHLMKPSHMNPSEAVHMMQHDLRASRAVPIHWGTFPLTVEHVLEPKQMLQEALQKEGVPQHHFPAWKIGETIAFEKEQQQDIE
jgi:L-ascorbate metabolism protein UlaG (beta-lactamase superfamily)